MKKMINIALIYAIVAMVGGVFYREFTKFNGFVDRTALGFVHTHLFLLGMIVFLVVALFMAQNTQLKENKKFKTFMVVYNIGVPVTALMLAVRGIVQVLDITLTTGASAAISGIAGLGHIFTGIGIILLLISLKATAKN